MTVISNDPQPQYQTILTGEIEGKYGWIRAIIFLKVLDVMCEKSFNFLK